MKPTHYQTGQGMISFIIGLLFATAMIAGVLFYLNKSKSDFKTLPNNTSSAPTTSEILTPSTIQPSSTEITDTEAIEEGIENQPSPPSMASANSSPTSVNNSNINTPEVVVRPHNTNPLKVPETNQKNNHTPSVTPELILNSGSLEKAQQANKTRINKKVILQIGSYNSQTDAEAQHAKLIMLGIESHISTVKISGAIKYRVQTNSINYTQANQIKNTLRQHNIDSLIRNAS